MKKRAAKPVPFMVRLSERKLLELAKCGGG
jgi:hypothetical protein